ncbi:hypothetical protein SAMN05444580_101222 [Rhodococcus tukisamuensis]|uniref:Uncharacterized protein n=1 Tax=Rhodococcus tukisamuensis TaxID=168276 RepID=A0A1G6ML72_9NOCA|nr:hypothetical protein SAMN05444580_101222 [Rhodococcus tukisamuensis]
MRHSGFGWIAAVQVLPAYRRVAASWPADSGPGLARRPQAPYSRVFDVNAIDLEWPALNLPLRYAGGLTWSDGRGGPEVDV